MADHYTAVIEVTHTSEAEVKAAPAGRPYQNQEAQAKPRKKREIARIVVRSDTMEKLQDRLGKHIELLVDDEGDRESKVSA